MVMYGMWRWGWEREREEEEEEEARACVGVRMHIEWWAEGRIKFSEERERGEIVGGVVWLLLFLLFL
jgi:hypothetical protein